MRVLVVEPWFGGSHRAWAEGYQRHSSHDIGLLTLPDQGWRWRMRGAALTLADRIDGTPDVILASSMLDVAQFLGHARRVVGGTPVALFMHENQLTYPVPPGTKRDMGLALTNWTSMAAADRVIFNSEYHQRVWFQALPEMLGAMPEPSHVGAVAAVREKSVVLPVGVELDWVAGSGDRQPGAPLIVWSHRWEHDKRPDVFAAAIRELASTANLFRVAILGEAPFGVPDAFVDLPDLLGERLIQFGYADRPVYEEILRSADVVVSTADHEFFGVAIVEAMGAGALPVVPDRLSYPELMPSIVHEFGLYSSLEELGELLASALARRPSREALGAATERYSWERVAPRYDELLVDIVG